MKKIKFWKENKLDQEYELTTDEIKEKFISWCREKGKIWVENMSLAGNVASFIGSSEGLNSVIEDSDYSLVNELLRHLEIDYSEPKISDYFIGGKLKVSHYPQIPCEPFEFSVNNELEALRTMNILSQQHLFLYDQNVIEEYSNVMIVSMFNEKEREWENWFNEKEGLEWEEFEGLALEKFPELFNILINP